MKGRDVTVSLVVDGHEDVLVYVRPEDLREMQRCYAAARAVTRLWNAKPAPIPGGWTEALVELGRSCGLVAEEKA